MWSAVVALAATGCWASGGGSEQPSGTDRVAAGRVCRSTLPRVMELSCGRYGFGDVRYVCPAKSHDTRRCARTCMVTVRNSGSSRVYVTYIAGARQGVRDEGPEQALERD